MLSVSKFNEEVDYNFGHSFITAVPNPNDKDRSAYGRVTAGLWLVLGLE